MTSDSTKATSTAYSNVVAKSSFENDAASNDVIEFPVPLEGLTFSLKRDLNPCHPSPGKRLTNESVEVCDVTTTRVFSSRFRLETIHLVYGKIKPNLANFYDIGQLFFVENGQIFNNNLVISLTGDKQQRDQWPIL